MSHTYIIDFDSSGAPMRTETAGSMDETNRLGMEYSVFRKRSDILEVIEDTVEREYSKYYYDMYEIEDLMNSGFTRCSPMKEVIENKLFHILRSK